MAAQALAAFVFGLISIVTPCVLPLVPGYLSAVSAVEASRLGEPGIARRVALASQRGTVAQGSLLLLVYSGGLALAFLAVAIGFTRAMGAFRWLRDRYVYVQTVSGSLLVALGLLFFFHRDWWLRVLLNRVLE